AEAGAAIFLFHGNAVQAERAHPGPEVAREFVFAVDLVGARGDAVTGEIGHRLPQHVDVRSKPEIEARPGIGDHRRRLPWCPREVYRLALRLSAPARALPAHGRRRAPCARSAGRSP